MLYRQNGDQVEVYGQVQRGRYKHICTSHSGKMHGDMAMVEGSTQGMKKVCSVAPPLIRPIPPTDFLDVLRGWGQTWIWDDLCWRSLLSILVLILTLVSTGRPGRDAESV